MDDLTKKILIYLSLIILIFFSPISLSSTKVCSCGGCCDGCPGNCEQLGFPLAYHYSGSNYHTGIYYSKISILGILVDIVALSVLLCLAFTSIRRLLQNEGRIEDKFITDTSNFHLITSGPRTDPNPF